MMKTLTSVIVAVIGVAVGIGPIPLAKAQSLEWLAGTAIELHQDDLLVQALAKGANVNGRVSEMGDLSLLGIAVRHGDVEAISILRQRGADINMPSGTPPLAPLQEALEANNVGEVLALLRLGADPKVGSNALARYAVDHASVPLLQAAFGAGVSPNAMVGRTTVFGRILAGAHSATAAVFGSCDPTLIARAQALSELARIALAEKADFTEPVGKASDALQYAAQAGEWTIGNAILGARAQSKVPLPSVGAAFKLAHAAEGADIGNCPGAPKAAEVEIAQFATRLSAERRAFIIRLLRELL